MQRLATDLPLLVEGEANGVEILDNLFGGMVLLDLAVEVETNHVAGVDLGRELEELLETLLFSLLKVLRTHCDDNMNVDVIRVLLVVLCAYQYLVAQVYE
jgi:hypothetical protein